MISLSVRRIARKVAFKTSKGFVECVSISLGRGLEEFAGEGIALGRSPGGAAKALEIGGVAAVE